MKKVIVAVPLVLALMLATPLVASAHEVQVFEIKGTQYQVVIGSLNEPLVVDDKSGVDLRVSTVSDKKPVEGLQDTLKVELIAGDKKKEVELDTVYNTPGSYKAPFFPTVATTLSYRVFGEIAGTPFNATFTCQAAGHAEATEDKTRVEVSDGVARISKTGGFGCPGAKAELGFPETSADIQSLKETEGNSMVPFAALVISAIALGAAIVRRK